MKKIVWNALLSKKKLSASPKNGNPPPKKNNGPSLNSLYMQDYFNPIQYGRPLYTL